MSRNKLNSHHPTVAVAAPPVRCVSPPHIPERIAGPVTLPAAAPVTVPAAAAAAAAAAVTEPRPRASFPEVLPPVAAVASA